MQTDKPHDEGIRMNDRRSFLAQLAGLAAASALRPTRALEAAEASPPSGPLPTIQIGKHRISRLVAGSNPILGYSYSGQHTDRHMKEYYTPQRTAEFLQNCERRGHHDPPVCRPRQRDALHRSVARARQHDVLLLPRFAARENQEHSRARATHRDGPSRRRDRPALCRRQGQPRPRTT